MHVTGVRCELLHRLATRPENWRVSLLFNRLMKDQTIDSALQRNPDEWKTGDEPMTDAHALLRSRHSVEKPANEFNESLSKADASKRIDELRQRPRLTGAADHGDRHNQRGDSSEPSAGGPRSRQRRPEVRHVGRVLAGSPPATARRSAAKAPSRAAAPAQRVRAVGCWPNVAGAAAEITRRSMRAYFEDAAARRLRGDVWGSETRGDWRSLPQASRQPSPSARCELGVPLTSAANRSLSPADLAVSDWSSHVSWQRRRPDHAHRSRRARTPEGRGRYPRSAAVRRGASRAS